MNSPLSNILTITDKKRAQLLLLDTRFFRNLVESPRDQSHTEWQEFHLNHINEIGIEKGSVLLICTPHTFLEYIGITNFERPALDLIENKKITKSAGMGEAIFNAINIYYDAAKDFFSKLPELQKDFLISTANQRRANYTSNKLYAQNFADTTYVRFLGTQDFTQQIHTHLSIDLLQGYLDGNASNGFIRQAQLQLFKDSVEAVGSERNISFFRLLRSIAVTLLPSGTVPKILRLRKYSDILDCDYVHYAIFGYSTAGERHPVYVYTGDSRDLVYTRLNLAKFLYRVISENILKRSLNINLYLPTTAYGKVFICNPENTTVVETIDVATIPDDQFQID